MGLYIPCGLSVKTIKRVDHQKENKWLLRENDNVMRPINYRSMTSTFCAAFGCIRKHKGRDFSAYISDQNIIFLNDNNYLLPDSAQCKTISPVKFQPSHGAVDFSEI